MTILSNLYLLDAGVIFSTWTKGIQNGTFLTTPGVLQEVRNKPSQLRAEILLVLEKLQEETPESDSLKAVHLAAQKTGDDSVLSEVDVEILALAHTKKSQNLNPILVSSDMAILNTAQFMGISILDPTGKFRHEIIWSYKCPACNHTTNSMTKDLECPVCGTRMKRIVSKKRNSR